MFLFVTYTLTHGVRNCLTYYMCLLLYYFAGDIYAVRYGRLKRKDTQFQNNNLLPYCMLRWI
jgi:hypothetical protein